MTARDSFLATLGFADAAFTLAHANQILSLVLVFCSIVVVLPATVKTLKSWFEKSP